MSIQAKDVKRLRERTSAGMMDCHKALKEAGGDIEAAVDILRKQGVVKAAKRAEKIAAEGTIEIAVAADNRAAVIVELNCETDFVARGDEFKAFAQKLAQWALKNQIKTAEALLKSSLDEQQSSVEQAIQSLAAKVGENVQLRRLHACIAADSSVVGCYLHHGRVGALVALDKNQLALAEDIAMHVVAMNPIAISSDDCPPELLAREKEIFAEQAKNSGKPEHIIDKMIQGRLDKFLKEQTLLSQPFVKDTEKTIADLLKAHQANVLSFVRYEVGEGTK
jgi:elongation factor Ts